MKNVDDSILKKVPLVIIEAYERLRNIDFKQLGIESQRAKRKVNLQEILFWVSASTIILSVVLLAIAVLSLPELRITAIICMTLIILSFISMPIINNRQFDHKLTMRRYQDALTQFQADLMVFTDFQSPLTAGMFAERLTMLARDVLTAEARFEKTRFDPAFETDSVINDGQALQLCRHQFDSAWQTAIEKFRDFAPETKQYCFTRAKQMI